MPAQSEHTHSLPDTQQSAWSLSSIQLAGISSLPVFASSVLLSQKYSFMSTLASLILGNILLIFIRYYMIVMGEKGRKSTLDIAKDYLGETYWAVAIVLLFATTAWYVTQNTYASNSILYLFPVNFKDKVSEYIQVVVLIGVISTLFCMEGIALVRKCTVASFPILFSLILFITWIVPTPSFDLSFKGFSLAGVPIVIATNLGVAADIPTFFRHSKSRKASMISLAIISVFNLILSIIGVFLSHIILPWYGINTMYPDIYSREIVRWSLIAFIFISAINANITNIYSASVAWEVIAPKLARKEWLILGLGLVIVTVLIINVFSLSWFLDFADSGLVNLTLIFVTAYLVSRYFKVVESFKDKMAFAVAWGVGFIVTALNSFNILLPKISSLYLIVLSILIVLTGYYGLVYLKKQRSFKVD